MSIGTWITLCLLWVFIIFFAIGAFVVSARSEEEQEQWEEKKQKEKNNA